MLAKALSNAFLVLVTIAILIGCEKTDTSIPVEGEGHYSNTDAYNKLVERYNALLNSSHALQVESEEEASALQVLDDKVMTYVSKMTAVRFLAEMIRTGSTPNTSLSTAWQELETAQEDALVSLLALEKQSLEELDLLYSNASSVYLFKQSNADAIKNRKATILKKSRALAGIGSLLVRDFEQTHAYLKASAELGNYKNTLPEIRKKIQVSQRDEKVQIAVSTSNRGFFRTQQDQVVAMTTKAEVVDTARTYGIPADVASDAYELSSQSGGMVSFALDRKQLPTTIGDAISHFKPMLNQNGGDLEIAFLVDYSGSMSDDIEAVLKGLTGIVTDMENVRLSGRAIRLGVVTFGEQGKEAVNLGLTSDFALVRRTLESLLTNYQSAQHSDNPGEASYHGLDLAASSLKWSSPNRMTIVITDEGSKEQQTGQHQYVSAVQGKLKATGIQNHIYTIVVK